MKKNKIFAVFVTIALLLGACNYPPAPPTSPPFIPVTGSESIGVIIAMETLVEAGPSDNLVPIVNTGNFFNNQTVHVANGGIAQLDFIKYRISIRLSNDTEVGAVKADVSDTANPIVRMKLVRGGLSGEVTKDGVPVNVEITNGVNVEILGTQFLVIYDPGTGTTYIGNFDGTVAYSLPGQTRQFVQAGQKYEISSNFEIKQSPLTFTRNEIDNRTLNSRSTLLDTLEEFSGPTLTPTSTPTITPTPFPTLPPTITPTPTLFPTSSPSKTFDDTSRATLSAYLRDNKPLVALRVNSGDVIDSVTPVFAIFNYDFSFDNIVVGNRYGGEGGVETILEKDGYIITGIDYYLGNYFGAQTLVKIKVIWHRLTTSGIDPNDRFESELLGSGNYAKELQFFSIRVNLGNYINDFIAFGYPYVQEITINQKMLPIGN